MNGDTTNLVERAPSLDCDGRAAYRVKADGGNLTTAIVGAVAEVTNCDPVAEGFRLFYVLDPDALSRLFRDDEADRIVGKVVFELRGCRVEVYSDGEHVVYEPEDTQAESRVSPVGST